MKVQGLKKNYGKSTVVDNVSFEIHKGMVTSFIGPEWGRKVYSYRNDIKTGCKGSRIDFISWKRTGKME